jgi:hypothetical protein
VEGGDEGSREVEVQRRVKLGSSFVAHEKYPLLNVRWLWFSLEREAD